MAGRSRIYQDTDSVADSGFGDNDSVYTDDSGNTSYRKGKKNKYLIVKPLRRNYDADDEQEFQEKDGETLDPFHLELEDDDIGDEKFEGARGDVGEEDYEIVEESSEDDEDETDDDVDIDFLEDGPRPLSAHWTFVRDYFLGGEYKRQKQKELRRRPESAFYSLSRRYKLNLLLRKLQLCESSDTTDMAMQIQERLRSSNLESSEALFFNFPGNGLTHPEVIDAVRDTLRGNMTDMDVKVQFIPMSVIVGDARVLNRWALSMPNPRSRAYLQLKGITVRGNHLDLQSYDRVFEEERARVTNLKRAQVKEFVDLVKEHKLKADHRRQLKNFTDMMEIIDFSKI